MFSIHPFPGTPPDPLEGISMLNEETVSAMGDALKKAEALLRMMLESKEILRFRAEFPTNSDF